jgi:hypothetical protein
MRVVFLMLSALSLPLGASNISGEWKVTGRFHHGVKVAGGSTRHALGRGSCRWQFAPGCGWRQSSECRHWAAPMK